MIQMMDVTVLVRTSRPVLPGSGTYPVLKPVRLHVRGLH